MVVYLIIMFHISNYACQTTESNQSIRARHHAFQQIQFQSNKRCYLCDQILQDIQRLLVNSDILCNSSEFSLMSHLVLELKLDGYIISNTGLKSPWLLGC